MRLECAPSICGFGAETLLNLTAALTYGVMIFRFLPLTLGAFYQRWLEVATVLGPFGLKESWL